MAPLTPSSESVNFVKHRSRKNDALKGPCFYYGKNGHKKSECKGRLQDDPKGIFQNKRGDIKNAVTAAPKANGGRNNRHNPGRFDRYKNKKPQENKNVTANNVMTEALDLVLASMVQRVLGSLFNLCNNVIFLSEEPDDDKEEPQTFQCYVCHQRNVHVPMAM